MSDTQALLYSHTGIRKWMVALAILVLISTACWCYSDQTVYDMSGSSVSVPDSISRIATVEPVGYQLLILLDEEDKLTGACTGWANRTLLKKINPVFSDLPWPGDPTSVNLEELLKEEPDIVISKVGYAEKSQSMRDVGLHVFEIYPENPQDLIKSLSLLGILLHKEDKAEEFSTFFEETLSRIQELTQTIPQTNKKRVYIMGSSPLDTAGSDYYQHYMVEAAGGVNVASDLSGGWNSVSLEEIYSWNPDVIIMMPYTSANPEELFHDPAWEKVTAVRNNQIYRLPKYIMAYDMPVPESILGIMWMAQIMYPDIITFDIVQEMKTFYSKFYRLDIRDADIDTIITDQSKMKSSFDEIPGFN
jgi:iron complex transport system substrate-binding protein